MVTKSISNPIITPNDVVPSKEGYKVIAVLNCGVVRFGNEIILLLRVAEQPINIAKNTEIVSIYDEKLCDLVHITLSRNDESYDFSDSRKIVGNDKAYLTSVSHLRVARSRDFIHFTIDKKPALFPSTYYESYGIEDPRITKIGNTFYICYACAFDDGVVPCLASTKDFISYKKHGIMFAPDNKDVLLFPEKIDGKYYALHRPSPSFVPANNMWIASSPDLIHWGNHCQIATSRKYSWDNGRIGAGAVPIKTEFGWLEIYHGADNNNCYCLGAMLLKLDEPSKVISRLDEPIMLPTEKYEKIGLFNNVVFICGAIEDEDEIIIYYGAADCNIAVAYINKNELLSKLLNVQELIATKGAADTEKIKFSQENDIEILGV